MGIMSLDLELSALIAARKADRLPDPAIRRLARESAGLTQAELASVLGVSRPAVTRWENGTREPRDDKRVAYAQVLRTLLAATP